MSLKKMWMIVLGIALTGVLVTGCSKIAKDKKRGIEFSEDNRTLQFYPRGFLDKSYTVPDGITEIGREAFMGNKSLTSVTIPSSVTEIGFRAFKNCESLTSVTIPSSVTEIKSEAFENCKSLKRVNIPSRVTKIGTGAFYGCPCKWQVERDYSHLFK